MKKRTKRVSEDTDLAVYDARHSGFMKKKISGAGNYKENDECLI